MSAPLRIGSLCSGYGGLDLAVEEVLDARTAWVSDIDKGACKERISLVRAAAAWSGEGPRLLPTPTVDDSSNLTRESGEFQSLTRAVTSLLPTPRAREMEENPASFAARQVRMAEAGRTRGDSGMPLNVAVNLLPTPAVNDMGRAYTPETWDAWTAEQQAKHGNGNGHGKSLEIEAQRLANGPHSHVRLRVEDQGPTPPGECCGAWTQSWVIPDGTDYGLATTGSHNCRARFDEWMMGLPAGWITDVPGVTRNEALKLCGNGVVPQQAAAAALRFLLGVAERGAA